MCEIAEYEISKTKCFFEHHIGVSDVWSLAICRVGQDKAQKVSACPFLFGSQR